MPSSSPKQRKLMRAVAHSQKFAQKVGVPQSVGREFKAADQHQHMPMHAQMTSHPGSSMGMEGMGGPSGGTGRMGMMSEDGTGQGMRHMPKLRPLAKALAKRRR